MENKLNKGKAVVVVAPFDKFDPSSSSPAVPAPAETYRSRRFHVELNPDETTIVDWKHLCEEDDRKNAATQADSALNQTVGSENKDNQPPKRMDGLIKKIENLYVNPFDGKKGEYASVPDSDQYDTEDSFIDDSELDDYFKVDKSATKYDGYYINRGKLDILDSPQNMEVTDIPRENRNALGKNAPIEKKRASSSLGYHEKPHQKVKHLKNNASGDPEQGNEDFLERAILELEYLVAESQKAKLMDDREAKGSQINISISPHFIIHQLAKVVRFADIQGIATCAIFADRMIKILGDVMGPQTVKNRLKEMLRLGQLWKQKNAIKFQKIRGEVIEMIQDWMESTGFMELHIVSDDLHIVSDDLHIVSDDLHIISDDLHMINIEMGEKLYQLYSVKIEGMEKKKKQAQSNKIYEELAKLWPDGYMNKDVIKKAVKRAKYQKRAVRKRSRQMAEEVSFVQATPIAAAYPNSNPMLGFRPCSNKGKGIINYNNDGKESRPRKKRIEKTSFDYNYPGDISKITHVIALPSPNLPQIYKQQ